MCEIRTCGGVLNKGMNLRQLNLKGIENKPVLFYMLKVIKYTNLEEKSCLFLIFSGCPVKFYKVFKV